MFKFPTIQIIFKDGTFMQPLVQKFSDIDIYVKKYGIDVTEIKEIKFL